MLRKFLKDGVLYGLGSTVSKALAVLIVPIYTRLLNQQDFGALDYLAVFGTLSSFIVPLNITQGLARYFAQSPSDLRKKDLASSGIWFTAMTYALWLVVSQLWATPISDLLLGESWTNVFRIAAISFATTGVFYYFQNQLRWSMKPRQFALVSVLNVLVKVSLAVGLIVVAGWGIEGIFLATIVADLLSSLWSWWFCRDIYGLVFRMHSLKIMLAFSLPLVPNSIAAFLATFLDRVMIKYFLGLDDLGVYSVGARVAGAVGLVLGGFQAAVLPLVYQHLKQADTPLHLARIFRYFLALCLTLIVLIGAFSREITAVMGPPSYAAAATVMAILSGAVLLTGMKVFCPGISISRKTWWYLVGNGITLAMNFALNGWWIPRWGIFGAALATFCSATVGFAFTAVIGHRFYPIAHIWWRVGGVSLLVAAVLLGKEQFLQADMSAGPMILKAVAAVAFSVFIGFLMLGRRETAAVLRAAGKRFGTPAK